MLNKTIYLVYYFKNLDWQTLSRFFNYVSAKYDRSKVVLWIDIIRSSLKYNISILDYFYFSFYELSKEVKASYAGTGFMYEYQLKMNPRSDRRILENKILFLETYSNFVFRLFASIEKLKSDFNLAKLLLNNPSGKLVLKGSMGQVGAEVEVVYCDKYDHESLVKFMVEQKYDLAEEYINQHHELMNLSASGLNSVRLITQVDKNDNVIVLAARLRITINSAVDNLGAGNIAAPVNVVSGVVSGPAIYSDITKPDITEHPISGVDILNLKLPYWPKVLKIVKQAALVNINNRSVGWDVAITENGPELIEGNHNWCKLLWQLPAKKGLKSELLVYL